MKYLHPTLVALVSGFILAGCSSTPIPVESGYLADYTRLRPATHLTQYWVDTDLIIKSEPPNIALGTISAPGIIDKEGVTVADCIGWLKTGLLSETAISDNNPDARYRLDVAITYMDPGSAADRILAGEFGAGEARLQTEGKITDMKTGQLVATYVESQHTSGEIGLNDIVGDSETDLIELLIRALSKNVNKELLASFSL